MIILLKSWGYVKSIILCPSNDDLYPQEKRGIKMKKKIKTFQYKSYIYIDYNKLQRLSFTIMFFLQNKY